MKAVISTVDDNNLDLKIEIPFDHALHLNKGDIVMVDDLEGNPLEREVIYKWYPISKSYKNKLVIECINKL